MAWIIFSEFNKATVIVKPVTAITAPTSTYPIG